MSLDVPVPRTVLPLLDSHNYHTWAIELQTFFEARKLWDIVTGDRTGMISTAATTQNRSPTASATAESSSSSPGATAQAPQAVSGNTIDPEFRHSDASIRSILLSSVDPTQRSHIIRITTAKGMWDTLSRIHNAPSRNRTMALVNQLVNYEPRTSSINEMASALEDLKSRIAAISPKSVLPDEYMILKLVKIAGPAYDTVRELLMDKEELTWTDAVARLREKEIALSTTDMQLEHGLAAQRVGKRFFPGLCYNCGRSGHNARHCKQRRVDPNEKQHRHERQLPSDQRQEPLPYGRHERFSQKRLGHTERRHQHKRQQLTRAPPDLALQQAAAATHSDDDAVSQSDSSEYCLMATQSTSAFSGTSWMLDSGATSHMTADRALFTSYKQMHGPLPIYTADGSGIPAIGKGNVIVALSSGKLRIRNVFHVPGLAVNLLSIPQLAASGVTITFTATGATLLRDGCVLAQAQNNGNRYILSTSNEAALACMEPPAPFDLWHQRLGHLGRKKVAGLNSSTIGLIEPIGIPAHVPPCDTCLRTKICKINRRYITRPATKILERVHTDFCGPLRYRGINNEVYVLTLMDEYSRKLWAIPTVRRTDLYPVFNQWQKTVERQTGRQLLSLRSDNAKEYEALGKTLVQEGIRTEFSVSHTPQQNGLAERVNRTIFSLARALLLQASLPARFWSLAVRAAAYIQNRVLRSGSTKTPEELWTGRTPDVAHLRVWGCLAYGLDPATKRKLDLPGARYIFVGYTESLHQYYLMDAAGRISVAESVTFVEDIPGSTLVSPSRWLLGNREPPSVDWLLSPVAEVAPSVAQPLQLEQQPAEPLDQPGNSGVTDEADACSSVATLPEELNTSDATLENRAVTQESAADDDVQQPAKSRRTRTKIPVANGPVRRSSRTRRPAKIFGMSATVTNAPHAIPEPRSYAEALHDPAFSPQWEQAIQEELTNLTSHGTWELVDSGAVPPTHKPIGCRWVFKVKYEENGLPKRFKARLVAQGFTQRPGIDYFDTFAPTLRLESMRLILAIVAAQDLELHQLDIVGAYLEGPIDEELYMRVPDGVHAPGKVCRLRRGLYGLKQAGRNWNKTITASLLELGFHTTTADPSVFVHDAKQIIIGLYVDDLLLASPSIESIAWVKRELGSRHRVKDLGEAETCVGIHIHRDRVNRRLAIDQEAFLTKVLKDFDLLEARGAKNPAESCLLLAKGAEDEELFDVSTYQKAVGCLMWAMVGTRPDISFAIGKLSQHNHQPVLRHWRGVQRIFRYLQTTQSYSIVYGGNDNLKVVGYGDADYAGDLDDRKSTSGQLFTVAGGAVVWASRKQSSTATSTAEAEYIALSLAGKTAKWLRTFLADLHIPTHLVTPITLNCDNTAAIALARDPKDHSRSKHVDVHYHLVRELVEKRIIELRYCPTNQMLADGLTKPLIGRALEKFVESIGLHDSQRYR
jgi:hypothetical protein